jgi:hypothetical protein
MNPLIWLLYTLASLPFLIVVALLVNLVVNNIIETRAKAREYPKRRKVG